MHIFARRYPNAFWIDRAISAGGGNFAPFFSPLGKLADRAIYFTFRNFFFFTRSKAISVCTGPIFTIFSPNGRHLREFS